MPLARRDKMSGRFWSLAVFSYQLQVVAVEERRVTRMHLVFKTPKRASNHVDVDLASTAMDGSVEVKFLISQRSNANISAKANVIPAFLPR